MPTPMNPLERRDSRARVIEWINASIVPVIATLTDRINSLSAYVATMQSTISVARGETGPAGPPGPVGPPGAAGSTGSAGSNGSNGTNGVDGAPGATGAQGPQGAQGIQGVPGPAGPQGPQGVAGSAGTKGDKGDAGSVGATGPAGVQGAQGPIGLTGPAGTTGSAGATGAQGPAGSAGATGAQGPQGIQGATGPAGADGAIYRNGTSASVTPKIGTYTGTTDASGLVTIAFPTSPSNYFSTIHSVQAQPVVANGTATRLAADVYNISATGCTVRVNASASTAVSVLGVNVLGLTSASAGITVNVLVFGV